MHPYVSHLLGVASIVIDAGGDEDAAMAALPHGAVEDQVGKPTLDRLRHLFGDTVADVVAECSDADIDPKRP